MARVCRQNSDNDIKVEAFQLCREFLGAPWTDIELSQFSFSRVSGGLMNKLYKCSLPEDVDIRSLTTPRQVLLRIYGLFQNEEGAILNEATTVVLLGEKNLGPKIYGVFENGRIEEFIPSRNLKTEDYRQMFSTIASEMAKIHALDIPVRKAPDFWYKHYKKFLKDVETKSPNGKSDLIDFYREEYNWLKDELKKTNSPVVYSHNDLHGGNIILRQDVTSEANLKLVLIDFELGAYNYRGFDIANHFCEWCFNYSTGAFPFFNADFDKYPSKSEQTAYIRAYLNQLVIEGTMSESEVDSELDLILEEVLLFSMSAHLLWSLWSLKMTFLDIKDFSHTEYGAVRRNQYIKLKKQYIK